VDSADQQIGEILNEDDEPVRSWEWDGQQPGTVTWDGRDSAGEQVNDGRCFPADRVDRIPAEHNFRRREKSEILQDVIFARPAYRRNALSSPLGSVLWRSAIPSGD
jgi:hypothetical protein